MRKIAIDCGHTLSGSDYGAVGVRPESILTREVGYRVINILIKNGYNVIDCTVDTCTNLSDSLQRRASKANLQGAEMYVSIHFNCFNGTAHGTEVLTYGGKEISEAKMILNNITSLGFSNRGIKDGSKLYVLRKTAMKSMLVECCFCDNKNDMNIYDKDKMAEAIAYGIMNKSVPQKEVNKVVKYDDKTNPVGDNIFAIPNTNGYIEQASDGRLIIHKDRGNYIGIGKGYIDISWDDNKGNRGNKRISE